MRSILSRWYIFSLYRIDLSNRNTASSPLVVEYRFYLITFEIFKVFVFVDVVVVLLLLLSLLMLLLLVSSSVINVAIAAASVCFLWLSRAIFN